MKVYEINPGLTIMFTCILYDLEDVLLLVDLQGFNSDLNCNLTYFDISD